MPKKVTRGSGLTKREGIEITTDELADDPSIALPPSLPEELERIEVEMHRVLEDAGLKEPPRGKIVAPGGYSATIFGSDVEEDTPEWFAMRILVGIASWKEANTLGYTMHAQHIAFNISGAYKIFDFKQNVEALAEKGLKHREAEQKLQKGGAEGTTRKRNSQAIPAPAGC